MDFFNIRMLAQGTAIPLIHPLIQAPAQVTAPKKKRERPSKSQEYEYEDDVYEEDDDPEYVPKATRRARKPAQKRLFLVDESYDNQEERLFQQALKNSRIDTCRRRVEVPSAPVYHPTYEEFQDPLAYVSKIRSEAAAYGICKIVPPPGWNAPCTIDFSSPKRMPTKLQEIHRLQSGEGFTDGRAYTIQEYRVMADAFSKQWSYRHEGKLDMETLEKDYWDAIEAQTCEMKVEYANDLDTNKLFSGFHRVEVDEMDVSGTTPMTDPHYYSKCGWNLHNIARWPGSLLRHITTPINGVNVPWLYMGMLFSSFCWHAEDNFLYSINYSHWGAPKQWYSVPGSSAKAFEKAAQASLRIRFDEDSDLLHHMTMQISPAHLRSHNIPVYELKQLPGEFVVTFPRAFHAGFNYGFNCNEAVNFAASDWLSWGMQAEEIYRDYRTLRPSVFSHCRLIFTLCQHFKDLPKECHEELHTQMMRMIDEDLTLRAAAAEKGVRDLAFAVRLPANDFSRVDTRAADYDDRRSCDVCKAVCVFSAVGCECCNARVACLRHYTGMCHCPHERKYMLLWASDKELYRMKLELDAALKPPPPAPVPQPIDIMHMGHGLWPPSLFAAFAVRGSPYNLNLGPHIAHMGTGIHPLFAMTNMVPQIHHPYSHGSQMQPIGPFESSLLAPLP